MNTGISLGRRVCLVAAFICAMASFVAAQQTTPPPKPPYDVLADRQNHYDALDQARDQALRDYPLQYDANGNVIKDAKYEAAIADYNRKKASSTENLRTNRRRDHELDLLRNQAGVPTDSKFDTGTPPHDPKYGGAFSDRDITVESPKHLNALVDSAKSRGYTVEHGGDYIRIKELDVVVWNPDKVTIRKTSSGETIVQRKPYSATAQVDRLHDAEVVLGHEKPGVSQQIKKAEADLRRPVPGSTREQHEMATNLGKAGYKAGKGVDADGSLGVVDADQRRKLDALKGRQATVDDIADPFDKPEARRRKLNDFRGEVETVLHDTLKEERRQRTDEANRLKRETADLHRQLGETTDVPERTRLRNEIETRRQRTEAMHQQQQADDLTLRVVEKKNPRVRDKVIHPERPVVEADLPHTPKTGKLTILKTYGLSIVGKGLGIYQAYETELSDSARDSRKFSQARMTTTMLTNMSGLTQVIASVEGFEYETGKGLQECVSSEVERNREEGYDVANNPGLQDVIRRRAILRATGRATWQGTKAVPFVGDLVSGVEDTYNLAESSIGVAYDSWKSRQTQLENQIEQKAQHERTVALAEEMRDSLRHQMELVQSDVRLAEEIAAAQAKCTTFVDALESRLRETTSRLQDAAKVATAPPSPVAANKLSEIDPFLKSVTKAAQGFVRDADPFLKEVDAGDVTRADLIERTGGFTRRMQAIDADYLHATERLETAQSEARRLAAAGDLASLRQTLIIDLETARATATTIDGLAERMQTINQRSADTQRCFDDQKQRLKSLCENKLYRLASDPIKETLRFIRAQALAFRLPTLALESHSVRAQDLRLQSARLKKLAEFARETATAVAGDAAQTSIENEDAKAWDRVLASADAMEKAVTEARDRMRRLRQAASNEPPIFNLTAKPAGVMAYQFEFTAANLSPGKKYIYAWNFGDDATDASSQLARKHVYAKPGRYEVTVGAFEETPKVSLKLGEASLVVNVGTSETTTTVVTGTPPDESEPHFIMLAVLSPDFDRQGNRVLKDLSGILPVIVFRVYPARGKVTAEFGARRGFYFEKSGVYEPFYHLTVDGTAEALLEPRSNRIEFATAPLKWEQRVGVYSLGGNVTQNKYGLADAYKRTGVDPTGLRWTGRISGELDWRSGRIGATTGRLEVNALISGDWKIAAVDGLDIGGGREQWKSPLVPRFDWFRLHPDVASAKQVIQANKLNWTLEPFPHDPAHEVFQSNQFALVRIGRWTAKWLGPGPRKQQQYEQLVKFINGPGRQLEQAVPAMNNE